jgi:hypothetical protein
VYTFLATLIVLIAVSLCILARSLALRARRRRQIADMLGADPTLLPPGWVDGRYYAFPRRREADPKARPVMWEVHVPVKDDEAVEKAAWVDILVRVLSLSL